MRMQAQLDKAWEVLTAKAAARETITYTGLAEALGPGVTRRTVGGMYLDDISEHCEETGAPDLTVLVVVGRSNTPSNGYRGDFTKVAWEQCKVFGHDWTDDPRPILAE